MGFFLEKRNYNGRKTKFDKFANLLRDFPNASYGKLTKFL